MYPTIEWSRNSGYEVSSAGDKRFSAFNARMPDGRSIEEHYQCDVKGYDPDGTNWKLGKGKPPRTGLSPFQTWNAYLALWQDWAQRNPAMMESLRARVSLPESNFTLRDRFATSSINQARALAHILNAQ